MDIIRRSFILVTSGSWQVTGNVHVPDKFEYSHFLFDG